MLGHVEKMAAVVMRARLLKHRKWTDEAGNLYGIVFGALRGALDILKASGTGSHSSVQEKALALLYDNHHPKGHHRHVGAREESYSFITVQQLVADFSSEVNQRRGETK